MKLTAHVVPGTAVDQQMTASVSFRGGSGDPLVTAFAPPKTFHPHVDVDVPSFRNINPNDNDVTGPTFDGLNLSLPRGYTGTVEVDAADLGLLAVPAGAAVTLQLTQGFTLGADGVHWGTEDGGGGAPLACNGATGTITCTGLPAIEPGLNNERFTKIPITVPASTAYRTQGAPVGR